MNNIIELKNKQRVIKSQLVSLKGNINKNDAESINRARTLVDEYKHIDETLREQTKLKHEFGSFAAVSEDKEDKNMNVKSIGTQVADNIAEKGGIATLKEGTTIVTDIKAVTSPVTEPDTATVMPEIIAPAVPAATVEDLFGAVTVSTPSVTYIRYTYDGGAGMTAEAGAKTQYSATPLPVTIPLKKATGYIKVSEETEEDYPALVSSIDTEAPAIIADKVEDQLINGTGTGNETSGLLAHELHELEYTPNGDPTECSDCILNAIAMIKSETNLDADAVIMDPDTYLLLRAGKDKNGQYYAGGYFAGAYGTSGSATTDTICGLKVRVSNHMPPQTLVVGAYRLGADVVSRGGVQVKSGYDGTDFTQDIITHRVERRFALAVKRPQAFIVIKKADMHS